MNEQLNLDPDVIELIARRVVALLQEADAARHSRYVDAATLAAALCVERDWVYSHADELGALRLGPNGRLRFDLPAVVQQLRTGRQPAIPASKVPQIQRRASGDAPTRSPKQHQTGGNPDDEA
jgi:hypothetical protein